jgi:hypothetical protein
MRSLTALLVFATGCSLYTHGGDDCAELDVVPGPQIRDPFTGQCHVEQNNCPPCAPCPIDPTPPIIGGAVCGGPCEALSETTCFDTKGCHAAYDTDPRGDGVIFLGCWAVAVGGPRQSTDACAQLDAQSCPYRDDCATWYVEPGSGARSFDHCASETARDSCEPGTCGAPPPCPSNSVATTRNGCYTGRCIAKDQCPKADCADLTSEAQCTQHTECEPLYRGDDCTCTPTSCTCEQRTFELCHDAPQ